MAKIEDQMHEICKHDRLWRKAHPKHKAEHLNQEIALIRKVLKELTNEQEGKNENETEGVEVQSNKQRHKQRGTQESVHTSDAVFRRDS